MIRLLLTLFILSPPLWADEACPELLNFTAASLLEHQPIHLCQSYKGKVVLIVNTASKCGYTYQYDGLEKLYQRYKTEGLVVLGFPSNDFGAQEPGTEKEVQNFCRLTYGVDFPMFAKSSVRQGSASPLYKALAQDAGTFPQWNFHKYLIDREGRLIGSFPSQIKPESDELIKLIESALERR